MASSGNGTHPDTDDHMDTVHLICSLKSGYWPAADRKRQSHLHGHKRLLSVLLSQILRTAERQGKGIRRDHEEAWGKGQRVRDPILNLTVPDPLGWSLPVYDTLMASSYTLRRIVLGLPLISLEFLAIARGLWLLLGFLVCTRSLHGQPGGSMLESRQEVKLGYV